MFFSALGLVLVFAVLLLARARQLEDMTAGWRMALYGALGSFFGGFFADGNVSGIFHWYGKTGLLLSAGGEIVLWGGVALMVIWIGLRAAMRRGKRQVPRLPPRRPDAAAVRRATRSR